MPFVSEDKDFYLIITLKMVQAVIKNKVSLTKIYVSSLTFPTLSSSSWFDGSSGVVLGSWAEEEKGTLL